MDHFKEWAGEVANSFFRGGVTPTDTITKIARQEELTPHQIEVLASEANKLIHNAKYATADQKYFAADFPLADSKVAIANVQMGGVEKTASAQFQEPVFNAPEIDLYAAFGVKEEAMDKTASVKHDLQRALEKTDLLCMKMDDRVYEVKTASDSLQKQFIKEARGYLIDDSNSADRMKTLGVLDAFVKSAGIDCGKKLLAKVAYVMAAEGKLEKSAGKLAMDYFMSKTADQKAPVELISGNLSAQIVNGQHPLYITLKTIGDLEADLLRYEQEGALVQDKARILKQKIRAL